LPTERKVQAGLQELGEAVDNARLRAQTNYRPWRAAAAVVCRRHHPTEAIGHR